MKPIVDHTLIVLERADDWMTPYELTNEVRAVFPKADMRPVFKKLRTIVNIGQDNKLGYRWYPWREGVDDITQAALDRGDDW